MASVAATAEGWWHTKRMAAQKKGHLTTRSSSSRGGADGGRTQDHGPAYLLIANTMAERIGAGKYRPGDRLPTEAELRSEFGVSPMTVRRAINILLDRHLVTTIQGKGTFVRTLELGEAVFRLRPIIEVLDDESVDLSLLEVRVMPADERTATILRCPVGGHTIHMRRVIGRAGLPLMYQLERIVYDERRPLVEAQLQITSLNGLLRSAPGQGMRRGDLAIEAVCIQAEEAEALGVPPNSPAFCLEHIFYDFEGRPVSWGRLLCRADTFRLETHLGAPPPPAEQPAITSGQVWYEI